MSTLLKFIFGLLLAVATHQTLTPKAIDAFDSPPDKLIHFLCWAILSASLYAAFHQAGRYRTLLAGLFGYSVILEIGQHWVPGRHFSSEDMIANGIGCLFVYAIVKFIEWRWPAIKAGKT